MQQTSYKAAEAYLLSQPTTTTLGIDTLLDKSASRRFTGTPSAITAPRISSPLRYTA
jgi:hypothetical protein